MIYRLKAKKLHDAFEIMISLAFGLSGAVQLMYRYTPPGSTAETLPSTSRTIWLLLVVFGCLFVLIGALSRYVWGYLVEQIGLAAAGGAIVAYGLQVCVIQFQRGMLSPATVLGGPLLIVIGGAYLWKWDQVRREVHALGRLDWKLHR